MDYYTQWDCPACDETNYQGVHRTLLERNGLPCVMLSANDQESYDCDHCGKTFYSGDTELMEE